MLRVANKNFTLTAVMLNAIMLSAIMLSAICCYTEFRGAIETRDKTTYELLKIVLNKLLIMKETKKKKH